MTNPRMTDDERRQRIVQQCRPAPRNPTGRQLDLRISVHTKGWFIGTSGAKDLSCSSKEIALAEMAKLLDLLQQEQQNFNHDD